MRISWKRIISTALAGCVSLTTLAVFPTFAEDEVEKYPYMMFASNTSENSIFLNATNITTNGKLCTNGTIYADATNCHLNGDMVESASEEMIYIDGKLCSTYFSLENPETVDSYNLNKTNVKINNPIQAENDITLSGVNVKIKNSFVAGGSIDIDSTNINIDSSIMAKNDITLNGTCLNNGGVVIYSQSGDITINTTNANFDSLIYAPYGNVSIDATNSNINGIIIANSITITGTNINVNYRNSIGEIVGTTSEMIDAPIDSDDDGLTDTYEQEIGTDSFNVDTDDDYLLDGDEVNIYHTDPLNPDTDGDGILDGDEISIGLNPNDSSDGNNMVSQCISQEELDLNKYNDEFKINIEAVASNNIKRYLEQDISDYSELLSNNNAVVGTPIKIGYTAGDIQSGKITFSLEETFMNNNPSYYDNLNLGIERYGVFYYDENLNTIVPLDCDYISESDISISMDYLGNIMIIDYEALMYDLGIPSYMVYSALNQKQDDDLTLGQSSEEKFYFNFNTVYLSSNFSETNLNSSIMAPIDLVLVIDSTGSMGYEIEYIKSNLSNLVDKLRAKNISLYVSVVDYKDMEFDSPYINVYNSTNNIQTAKSIIENISVTGGGSDLGESLSEGLRATNAIHYRDNATKFAFVFTDEPYKESIEEFYSKLQEKRIITSVVTTENFKECYYDLTNATNGIVIDLEVSDDNNVCNDMYDFILNKTNNSNLIVLGNNIVAGCLNEPLIYNGTCDTDGDTLTDSEEVEWKYIKVYDDGTYSLPTWKELCEKSKVYKESKNNSLFNILGNLDVIPVISNPFSKDTDGDYYPDNIDKNKNKYDSMYINDTALIDDDFCSGTEIIEKESSQYTDGAFESRFENNINIGEYSFNRESLKVHKFSLTPTKTSFYVLNTNANGFSDITITYHQLFGNKSVEPKKDGTYLLQKGISYTIEVYGKNNINDDYSFTIRQDNWLYAPYGAMINTVASNSKNGIIKQIYIPNEKILALLQNSVFNEYQGTLMCPQNVDELLSYYVDETTKAGLIKATNDTYGKLIYNALNNGDFLTKDVAFVNNLVGTGATLTGVVVLLASDHKLRDTIITLVSGSTVAMNTYIEGHINDLNESLINGQFNICIYSYTAYNVVNLNQAIQSGYLAWNNNKYINKNQSLSYTDSNNVPVTKTINCIPEDITIFEDNENYIKVLY
jgi:hypothetical protein